MYSHSECVLSHVWFFANSIDCSPEVFSVLGIFLARILEWVAMSYSSGSSQPRDRTGISCTSCIGRQILYQRTTWEFSPPDFRSATCTVHYPAILVPICHFNSHCTLDESNINSQEIRCPVDFVWPPATTWIIFYHSPGKLGNSPCVMFPLEGQPLSLVPRCVCSVTSNSLQPHRLYLAKLLCPWNFPGKNIGMGCHFLFQWIFLTQGPNQQLLHLLC